MTPEERGNRIALRQKPDDNLANRGGIIHAIKEAIAEEREACAKIADAHFNAELVAQRIRART